MIRDLLEKFGKSIGLAPRAIQQAFGDLQKHVRRAAPLITPPEAEPADGFVHRYSEIVNRACLRIFGE